MDGGAGGRAAPSPWRSPSWPRPSPEAPAADEADESSEPQAEQGQIAELAAEAEMLAPDAAAEVADDELEAPEWVMDEGRRRR